MKADRASATARVIAASALLSSHDEQERGLLAPGTAEMSAALLKTTGVGRGLLQAMRWRLGRAALRGLERWMLPGLTRHFLLRKAWIWDAWERARAEGFEQVVVLGAGMDMLALRAGAQGVRAVEVDHPATQRLKREVMAADTRVELVACDLGRESVAGALAGKIDPAPSTFVVGEGLLMYLPRERVRTLLAEVVSLGRSRVRAVFSAIEANDGRVGFRQSNPLVDWWLSVNGEPFQWGTTEAELAGMMEDAGFRVLRVLDVAQTEPGAENLEGELLVEVERE